MTDASVEFRRTRSRWTFRLPLKKARVKETKVREKLRAPRPRDMLADAPRWWLCLLIIVAPWAYGTTFPATKDLLAVALLVLIGLFVVSLILRGRRPRMHWLPGSITCLLVVMGWFMTWNAKLVYDPAVNYFHLVQQPLAFLPGTVDQSSSAHQMLLITGLVGAFWVVYDLAANPRWLDRVWVVMSLTGVSLIGLGIAQRVTGAPGIFWDANLDCGTTFFATYRYHANAGAFITLVFPLIVGRTVLALHGPSSDVSKAFWMLASLGTLAAAFINVSRASTAITMVLTIVLFGWQLGERIRDNGPFFTKRRISAMTILLGVGVSSLVWGIGFKDSYSHWLELAASIATNGRFIVDAAIVQHMLRVAGFWGFGPASFWMTFPFFTALLGGRLGGFWDYAHCDYLQTLTEWGVIGASLWFVLFGSGVGRTAWMFFRFGRRWTEAMRTCAVVFLSALTSMLVHATVDFPLQIASLQLYAAVLLGLVTCVGHNLSSEKCKNRPKKSAASRRGSEEARSMLPEI